MHHAVAYAHQCVVGAAPLSAFSARYLPRKSSDLVKEKGVSVGDVPTTDDALMGNEIQQGAARRWQWLARPLLIHPPHPMLHIVCNPTVPADARPNIKRFRAGYTHPQFAYCVFAILRVPSSAGCCRFEADGLGKTLERLNRDDLSRRLRSEMTPEETILFAFALLAVLDPLHKQTGDDRAFFKESVWSLTSGYVWFAVVGRRGFGMTPFVES